MQRIFFLVFALMLGFVFCAQAQDNDKPSYYQRPNNPKPAPQEEQKSAPQTESETEAAAPKKEESKLPAYTQRKFDMDRILIEPVFQFFFASQVLTFGLKPSVVYDVWKKKLFVGGSVDYNVNAYFKYPVGTTTKTLTVQSYGGGAVLHYNIWKGFYARLRPEVLAVRIPVSATPVGLNNYKINYETHPFPYLWIGGGWNLARGVKGLFMPAGIYFDPIAVVRQQNYTDIAGNGQKRYQLSPYGMVYFQIGIYILDPKVGLK